MNESKLNYLVKIISINNKRRKKENMEILDNSFINKFGIISYEYSLFHGFDIKVNKRIGFYMFYKDELEILYDEPVNNNMFSFCFLCGGKTKYIIYNEKRFKYCPKCLR